MKRFLAFILSVLLLVFTVSCEPQKAPSEDEVRIIAPVASEPPEKNGFPH